jgi:hypothetical protein
MVILSESKADIFRESRGRGMLSPGEEDLRLIATHVMVATVPLVALPAYAGNDASL